MARQIVIDFDPDPNDPSFSKVWFFGEELYRVLRDDGWASVPIEEVDKATNQLRVSIHSKRRVRRISSMIEQLLETHFLKNHARLSVITPAD